MSHKDIDTLLSEGFAILPTALDASTLDLARASVAALLADNPERGGVRNVLRDPLLRSLAVASMRDLVVPYLGEEAFAVRALVFDKTPTANWKVAWHQDVSISVTDYQERSGWGPWSRKAGAWHVRPPAAVLERMLTVRLHFDDCGATNGPVRVIPGSHLAGRLSDSQVEALSASRRPVDCLVEIGGALLMRPLLLHASAPASAPAHRRVFHVEYAAADLPDGFEWAERLGTGASAV